MVNRPDPFGRLTSAWRRWPAALRWFLACAAVVAVLAVTVDRAFDDRRLEFPSRAKAEAGEALIYGYRVSGLSFFMPLASVTAAAGCRLPTYGERAVVQGLLIAAGAGLLALAGYQLAGAGGAWLCLIAAPLFSRDRWTVELLENYLYLLAANALIWEARRRDRRSRALAAAAVGFCLLNKSLLCLLPLAWAAWSDDRSLPWRRRLREAALALSPYLVLLPWMYLNAATTGTPAPFEVGRADNNLIMGALGLSSVIDGSAKVLLPHGFKGSVLAWALSRTLRHPRTYLAGLFSRSKFAFFQGPAFFVLAALGLWRRRTSAGARALGWLAALLALMTVLLVIEPRYLEPLWPLLVPLAVVALCPARWAGPAGRDRTPFWLGLAGAPAALAAAATLALCAAFPWRSAHAGLDARAAAWPAQPEALRQLGRDLVLAGRPAEGARALRRAIPLEPEVPDVQAEYYWALTAARARGRQPVPPSFSARDGKLQGCLRVMDAAGRGDPARLVEAVQEADDAEARNVRVRFDEEVPAVHRAALVMREGARNQRFDSCLAGLPAPRRAAFWDALVAAYPGTLEFRLERARAALAVDPERPGLDEDLAALSRGPADMAGAAAALRLDRGDAFLREGLVARAAAAFSAAGAPSGRGASELARDVVPALYLAARRSDRAALPRLIALAALDSPGREERGALSNALVAAAASARSLRLPKAARAALDRARGLAESPGDWDRLAQAYRAAGDADEQALCLAKLAALRPDRARSWIDVAKSARSAAERSAARARARALPRTDEETVELALAYQDDGDLGSAVSLLNGVVARRPGEAAWRADLGVALALGGSLRSARLELRGAAARGDRQAEASLEALDARAGRFKGSRR